MMDTPAQTKTQDSGLGPPPAKGYAGEVVYLYAFDVAYDMTRRPVQELLGQPVAQFAVDPGKPSPRHLSLFRAQMASLPKLEQTGPGGPVWVERIVKLLPVGAISIAVHVPFHVARVEELVAYHDIRLNGALLHREVRALAEDVRRQLATYYIRPVSALAEAEAYTVFCLKSPVVDGSSPAGSTLEWLGQHRRAVASVLTQEPDLAQLSLQEAEESTGRFLSYYSHDLVVIDWDAALLVDQPQNFAEQLYVLELANLQLAELEAYDRILDDALERAYRDLSRRSIRGRRGVLHELREIRIDMARLSDELSNITKFFGDWHLARIYENVAARFHLAEWHRTIDGKLQALDDLYQIIQHERTNRWMLLLEVTIVVLFVIDLAILVLGLKH
jgi:hypothetical protein